MALTYISNDILCSLDIRDSVFVVLLDLSTAFDTVDHKLLLSRLEHRVRLGGQALDWAISYLSSRFQYVSAAGSSSNPRPLSCGVPRARYWDQYSSLLTLCHWVTSPAHSTFRFTSIQMTLSCTCHFITKTVMQLI